MKNKELARIFYEIADFLEADRVVFKPFAYRKVALMLEALEKDIDEVYREGGYQAVRRLPGVGDAIAKKIEEYLSTGRMRYFEELKNKTPLNMEELVAVEGLGPRKVKILFEKLGVRNLKDLEAAALTHKIAGLFGFGEQTEKNILQGITFLKKHEGRFPLGDILPRAREIYDNLKKLKAIEFISLAGSVRRRRETIGDIDILVVSKKPREVMDAFISIPGIVKIWGHGTTKSSVRFNEGYDVDVRVVPRRAYGAALQYFTGSKEHNIKLRKIAMDKSMKLNEYGLFKGKQIIGNGSEEDIYHHLGLSWIPPELRENTGEIEAATRHRLPLLVEINDIRGDLHCHSDWDGGVDPIESLVAEAKRMGYEYIGISDHTKFLRIENGLDEKKLIERNKYIDRLNSKLNNFLILKGCETNIMDDGSIDIEDHVLKQMDYVIAGVHSQFKMTKAQMMKRIIRAMENPHVDIIAHPTGRLIQRRTGYEIDFDMLVATAKRTGTILEINASPHRLDLNDYHIRRVKEKGVKMIINTDTHQREQLHNMEFGVAQARRGWLEKENIINTFPLKELIGFFKK